MRKSFLHLVIVGLIFMLASNMAAAEQELLFCSQSTQYGNLTGASRCQEMCGKYTCDLKARLSSGWKIVTSSPKEEIAEKWEEIDTRAAAKAFMGPKMATVGQYGCTCKGTEYVLEQAEDKPPAKKYKSKKDSKN
jgi:hypothetical protein